MDKTSYMVGWHIYKFSIIWKGEPHMCTYVHVHHMADKHIVYTVIIKYGST